MLRSIAAFVVAVLLLPVLALADGFIVIHDPPRPTPGHFNFAPLQVSYHRVNVEVKNRVAVTSIDQEFINPNSQQLEGTYLFPLPEGAHIDKFSMDVNGKMMDAELLDADKAREIYESIVRQHRDPALLEYVGRGAFKVRIFPIEANGKKQVKLQYTQVIKPDSSLSEYLYPLNTEKFSSRPLNEVMVRVHVVADKPIRSVYCPTHNVEIKRHGDREATVVYEEKNVRPDTDFKVMWTEQAEGMGISVLTYRTGSEDGYFLLMASPGITTSPGELQPKDITFVIDTSGSMAGAKMKQAQKALTFCLANLNAADRFEVIRFSTEAEALFGKLVDASAGNVEKAMKFAEAMKPIGGTAIEDALKEAMASAAKRAEADRRPHVVVFLTDGQPTIGQTREEPLVETVLKGAGGAKVYCFGIGTDINTHLLDRISGGTRALSQYVLPEENIEVKVSNFYTRIKEPALTDVELTFSGGIRATMMYPRQMPDIHKGETLLIFGRYSGSGPSAVTIAGKVNGVARSFSEDVTLTESDTQHAFIPQLWAMRRVGFLLDEIRLRGETAELKDEVVRLAREHGIVTPYTSYLIVEDERRRDVPMPARVMREMDADRMAMDRAKGMYDSASAGSGRAEKAGERAVWNSENLRMLRDGWNGQQAHQQLGGDMVLAKAALPPGVAPSTQPSEAGYRVAFNYSQQVRVVNGRAFFQNGEVWTDATVQTLLARNQKAEQRQVKFNSPEYFELLKKNPANGRMLSLGEQVDLVVDDVVYNVR